MVYIGVDLGGTNIAAGIVDASGKILYQGSVPTQLERGPEPIIEDMAKLCIRLVDEAGYTMDDVKSIGVGIPGITDPDTGVIVFCTNLGWHDVPLTDIIHRWVDKPIFMENDGTVAGLAESVAGVSRHAKNSVFLTLGTGVGGGIVIDGKVFSGTHHVGSELGHMIVELDGEMCTCGNKGCWERYASATAIINMGKKAVQRDPESLILKNAGGDPEKIDARAVIDAAKAGDAMGLECFNQYVYNLTMGIVTIINFIDPEIIALGGGVSRAGAFLVDAINAELPKHIFYKRVPYAKVVLAELRNEAGIIGAAMLGQ